MKDLGSVNKVENDGEQNLTSATSIVMHGYTCICTQKCSNMHMNTYTHLNRDIHMQKETKSNMITHEIKYLKVSTFLFQLILQQSKYKSTSFTYMLKSHLIKPFSF